MYQQQQKLTFMYIYVPISLCVFCFMVLHPSWLPLIHSSISYLCTFSSHLVTLATDKKYIFLLCNGILVLIAKYPSQRIDTRLPMLPETSPGEDLSFGKYQQCSQFSTEKMFLVQDVATNKVVEEKYVVYQITNGEEQEEEEVTNDGDDEKYEKEVEDEKYEQEEEKDGNEEYEQEEDVEEEEEETISKMSTEELNRKFDEFIRKMKEELRIEAQRQLILV
ncbi:unnamed protein product [Amaranthus hypochondriacus]